MSGGGNQEDTPKERRTPGIPIISLEEVFPEGGGGGVPDLCGFLESTLGKQRILKELISCHMMGPGHVGNSHLLLIPTQKPKPSASNSTLQTLKT